MLDYLKPCVGFQSQKLTNEQTTLFMIDRFSLNIIVISYFIDLQKQLNSIGFLHYLLSYHF